MSPRNGRVGSAGRRQRKLADRFALACLITVVAMLGFACSPDRTTQPVSVTSTAAPSSPSSHATASTSAPSDDVSTTSMPVEALDPAAPSMEATILMLTEVGTGFESPVLLVADPNGGADLVVEQSGRIVRNDEGHTVVLDITAEVTFAGEQGLLGLAFHPSFPENGRAYVNYVNRAGSTVIEEYQFGDGGFNTATRRSILTIEQPARNHNGGMIAFGPDGYLWIGMGDGGGANDRFGQAQDPQTLLGSMLRIDIDTATDGAYGIPADNPFADGAAGGPEVWATGLRNPWRFSFDGDDLWIGDVGQNEVEEINVVDASEAGLNFGWPVMEGTTCFESAACDPTPFVVPVSQYSHGQGCSITGGYVYRGDAMPELQGQYFYSDFCSGFLRSSTSDGTVFDWTDEVGETPQVSGFGIGADGELYVVSLAGSLFRVEEGS